MTEINDTVIKIAEHQINKNPLLAERFPTKDREEILKDLYRKYVDALSNKNLKPISYNEFSESLTKIDKSLANIRKFMFLAEKLGKSDENKLSISLINDMGEILDDYFDSIEEFVSKHKVEGKPLRSIELEKMIQNTNLNEKFAEMVDEGDFGKNDVKSIEEKRMKIAQLMNIFKQLFDKNNPFLSRLLGINR